MELSKALLRKARLLRKSLRFFLPHLKTASKTGYLPKVSYAQDGEDLALRSLMPAPGFYVDIGAHHPERFSVTKILYDSGWRGLNVDITKAMIQDFPARRPRDHNVMCAVGAGPNLKIYRFAEQALNTSDPELAEERIRNGRKLVGEEVVECVPLQTLLERFECPTKIDLLSIDVEGAELDVLRSIDWSKTIVSTALIEVNTPAHLLAHHPISQFLAERSLVPTQVFGRSALFQSHVPDADPHSLTQKSRGHIC